MRNSSPSTTATPRVRRFLSESAPTDWLKNWEDYEYQPGCESGVDLLSWFVMNTVYGEQPYDVFLGNDQTLPKKMDELLAFLEGLNNPALLPLINIVENTIKLCSEYDWGADPWLNKRVGGGSQDVNPPEFPNQEKADEQLWDVAVKPWTRDLLHKVSDAVYQSCVKGEISTEPEDQFRSDAEADADVFRSIGWGSDEDYGAGDERIDSQQHTKELVMDSKIDARIAKIRGLVTEAEKLSGRRSLREQEDAPLPPDIPAETDIEPVGPEAPEGGEEGESELEQVIELVKDITAKVKKNLTAYADEKVITAEEMEEFTAIIEELDEILEGMKSGADDGAIKEVLKVLADLLDRYISITSVGEGRQAESIEDPSKKPPEEKADTPKPDEKEVDPSKQIIKTPSDKPQTPTLPPAPSGSKA